MAVVVLFAGKPAGVSRASRPLPLTDQLIVHNDSLTLVVSADDYEVASTDLGVDGLEVDGVDASLIVGNDGDDVADVIFTGEGTRSS